MTSIRLMRADELEIDFSGFPLEDFPSTGTYISMQKLDPLSTMVQGLRGSAIFIRNPSIAYQVDITILPGSESDAWMQGAMLAQRNLDKLFSFSVKSLDAGLVFISGSCDITAIGNRDIAGDAAPPIVYSIQGQFPIANVASIANPGTATAEDITPFLT